MADFEAHIDLNGRVRPIGLARSNRVRGAETIMFEYDRTWLDDPDRFSLEPALALTRGVFARHAGLATFGSTGDSAPDTWGCRLMQHSERRIAEREGRAVRALVESEYLLGVADETRLGALRFRWVGEEQFQVPVAALAVPRWSNSADSSRLPSAYCAMRKPTKTSRSSLHPARRLAMPG